MTAGTHRGTAGIGDRVSLATGPHRAGTVTALDTHAAHVLVTFTDGRAGWFRAGAVAVTRYAGELAR